MRLLSAALILLLSARFSPGATVVIEMKREAEVERNIKMGCSPLIQLASFLATAWVAKRVPKEVVG